MGRLPLMFAGRPISWRIPYSMSGEVLMDPNVTGFQFPDATFLNNVDKPFEIHRVHIDVTGFTNVEIGGVITSVMIEPTPETLPRRVRIKITDFSKNETMNKSATVVNTLVLHNTRTHEWEEPYSIVRAEGFQVQVDTQSFLYSSFANPAITTPLINNVRVEVNFQGFLIVVERPSETR